MNKALYDDYKKLSETEHSQLTYKFKDSPVGLRLIAFLNDCTNRNFKNSDAVTYIYQNSSEQPAYAVLENRYFKLRKKIHVELQDSVSLAQTGEMLTEEQLILYRCKNLTSASSKEGAYKELVELEEICWKKNIFELLPDIIDQLIFFNQSFNRLERNKALFEKFEEASSLQYDVNRCIRISRQIYEINFKKGMQFAKRELFILKDLAEKHKKYPRFLMCYHHVSLYYKLGAQDYQVYQQVVSRHLGAFKKLFAKNPEVPLISYKLNYIKTQHFHFNHITMFYHFNRCEFNEAYHFMKDTWELVLGSDSLLKTYKTESLYFNLLTSQCMAGRLTEANETSSLFIAFLKENNQQEKLPFAYVQKARVISETYPQTFNMDMGFLMNQVEEYLKKVRKEDNVQAALDETLVLKAKLLFVQHKYENAKKVMQEPLVKKFLAALQVYDLMAELFQLYCKNNNNKRQLLEDLLKRTLQRKHKASTPGHYMHLNWLIHQVGYLLKNNVGF